MAYHAPVGPLASGLVLLVLLLASVLTVGGAQALLTGGTPALTVSPTAPASSISSPSAFTIAGLAKATAQHPPTILRAATAVKARPISQPPVSGGLPKLPSGIFSTPVQVSTTTTADQNGGPVFAYSANPSTVSDAAGYIWTAWAANISGRWSIFFASSSNDGSSFSTPLQLDSGATTQDTEPSLAVHGSGATAEIAVVWETRTGYTLNPSTADGYLLDVSTNAGSTWATSGTQANWWGVASYGSMDTVEGPAVGWTSDGYAEVAYWAYFLNYATYTTWPTGTVTVVDAYTSGTTICSASGCPGGVFEGPRSTTALYWPAVSMGCSTTQTDCSFSYSVTNSADTTDYIRIWYSTADFTTIPYDAIQVVSSTMSSPYASVEIGQGQTTYGTGTNDSLLTFLINTGPTTSPTFNVDYYYHSGISYVKGPWPTGSATSTGLRSAYIAGDPSTGAAFVSWVDSSNNIVATWASSPSAPFLAAQTVVAGGALSATSIGMTTSSSPSPFRVDVIYVDAGNPTSQIYYAGFRALYGSASASPTTVDLWQGVQFTASPGAGASPYTFSWNFGGACSPSCPTTTQNPLVNYTSPGTYTASVQITDTIGEVVTAAAGTVTVNPRLLVSITPTTGALDVGQSLSFTAVASGGSGTYSSYAWQVNGVTQAGAVASTFSYTFAAAGTATVAVQATDSVGGASNWAGATITVNSALTVSLAASPVVVIPGQSINFTATASGGTAPLSYVWTSSPTTGLGCAASSTATDRCTPTAAGTYMMAVAVTDSASPTVSKTAFTNVTVDSAMTASASMAPTSPQVGQTVYLNASVTGGTPAYTYTWLPGDGTGVLSGAQARHTYSAAGTFTARVFVNDSLGYSATATVSVSVVGALTILGHTATPALPNTTTMVTFSVSLTGGLTPYSVSWNFGDGTAAGTGVWTHHNYTAAGNYSVVITAKDSASHTASSTFNEQVVRAGTGCGSGCTLSATVTYSPNSPVAGLPVSFTVSATGGTGSYTTYAWNFGDGQTGTGNPVQHTYSAASTYTATVTVTDTQGHTGVGSTTFVVVAAGSFTATVSALPSISDVGENVAFTASAIGGSAPYQSFTFNFGDGSSPVVVTSVPAQTSHVYTTAGTFSVTVKVVDAKGVSTTSTPTSQLVYPALTVVITATAAGVDEGVNTIFTATASGGSGSYATTANWTFGDGSARVTGATKYGHVYHTSGTMQVSAVMLDTVDGAVATGSLNLSVYPPISVAVAGTPFNAPSPANVTLTATLSGGHGPYTLSWSFGDGTPTQKTTSGSGVATTTHTYQSAGGYQVQVVVTDSAGGAGVGFYNATVAAPNQPGIGLGSIGNIPWWLLLIIVAVVAAAVALALYLRRRRPSPEVSETEAFAPMAVAPALAAGGAALPLDMVAPTVPAGASDQSPDDFGGVLPVEPTALPPGTRMGAAGEVASALPTPAAAPAPEIATEGPQLCPRCGSGLIGEGIPCPTCQFVASPDTAAGTPASVAAAAPSAVVTGPGKLTHCPQCAGPLTPENECLACQVRWEPSHGIQQDGIGHPSAGPSAPPSAPSPPPVAPLPPMPAELTHCPQCGTQLAPGRICPVCQVSWEPSVQESPNFSDRSPADTPPPPGPSLARAPSPTEPSGAPAPVPPPPVVTEVPRSPPPPAAEPTPSAPSAPPQEPAAPAVAAPAPAPAPAPPPPEAPPAAAGPGHCFICSGPLENGFCPRCNMSWADEGG